MNSTATTPYGVITRHIVYLASPFMTLFIIVSAPSLPVLSGESVISVGVVDMKISTVGYRNEVH